MQQKTHPGLELLRCPRASCLHATVLSRERLCRPAFHPCPSVLCLRRSCWRSRTGAGCTPRGCVPTPGRTRYGAGEGDFGAMEGNSGFSLASPSQQVNFEPVRHTVRRSCSKLPSFYQGQIRNAVQLCQSNKNVHNGFLNLRTGELFSRGDNRSLKLVNISPALCLSPGWGRCSGPGFRAGLPWTRFTFAGFQVAQAQIRVASCKQGLEGNQRVPCALSPGLEAVARVWEVRTGAPFIFSS